jgi:selenium-binding protein 1
MPYANDELHHSGWNSCSSCYDDPSQKRDNLVVAGLISDRIYVIDVAKNPRAPEILKVLLTIVVFFQIFNVRLILAE